MPIVDIIVPQWLEEWVIETVIAECEAWGQLSQPQTFEMAELKPWPVQKIDDTATSEFS